MEDKISECIKDFLEEFKNKNKITPKDRKNNDKDFNYKIYNECSLQYELGIWLRDKLKSGKVGIKYEIYFEKNTKTFLDNPIEKTADNSSKCEVDLIIIGRIEKEIKEKYAIELKFPINGQYPEQMKKFKEDMKFMKKIYGVWQKEKLENCNTYCLTLVNDSNFYKITNFENEKNKDLYYQFRSGQQEEKIIKTKKKIDDTEIKLKKCIEWHLLNKDKNIRYYLVNIKKDVIMTEIETLKGDITELKVDAIVNAANTSLLGGDGVDGAIHKAAGYKLLEECEKLNGCKTGQSKITKGYDLPAKYVIHTVGPIWYGGNNKEGELLKSCYITSLNLAKKYGIKTIAFPAISCGAYGFPLEDACKIALDTVKDFISNDNFLEKVIFIDINDTVIETYERILNHPMTHKYLNRENYTELGKEVFDRLKKIWDQDDFLIGTMNNLKTEEALQKMLDFLIKTGTTDSDDVIPYGIKIRKGLV